MEQRVDEDGQVVEDVYVLCNDVLDRIGAPKGEDDLVSSGVDSQKPLNVRNKAAIVPLVSVLGTRISKPVGPYSNVAAMTVLDVEIRSHSPGLQMIGCPIGLALLQ